MKNNSINELSKQVYENAISKGFYEKGGGSNMGERLALIHSEVSEALEADRKGIYAGKSDALNANVLINDADFVTVFKSTVKDTFQDELADIVIRCFDTAAFKGIDLEQHILAKMRYNSMREYKHGKKY